MDAVVENTGSLPEQNKVEVDYVSSWVKQQMPEWFLLADSELQDKLIVAYKNYHAHESRLADHLARLKSPDAFARPLLIQAMRMHVDGEFDVDENIIVRLQRFSFNVTGDAIKSPLEAFLSAEFIPITNMTHLNLLGAALQNFSVQEVDSEFSGKAFILKRSDSPVRADLNPVRFALLCRDLNLGGQYQTYLNTVFWPYEKIDPSAPDLSVYGVYQDFITHEKSRLELLSHQAYLQRNITSSAYKMLLQWVNGAAQPRWHNWAVRVCSVRMLKIKHDDGTYAGCPLRGVLVFIGQPPSEQATLPCIVYSPHDKERPLYEYPSLKSFNDMYAFNLKAAQAQKMLKQTIELRYQSRFFKRLARALRIEGLTPSGLLVEVWRNLPDLEITLHDSNHTPFVELYRHAASLTLNNARLLAMPTRGAHDETGIEHLKAVFETGQPLLNLAAFFVPGLGEMLLLASTVELLSNIYTGIKDLTQGEVNEALEHFGSVAKSLVIMGVGAAATTAWRSVKPPIHYPPLMKKLQRVTTQLGEPRLWKVDLEPYASDVDLSLHLKSNNDGVYRVEGHDYVQIQGKAYEVKYDPANYRWRVTHPAKSEGHEPVVTHNGHGAWRLNLERAQEWTGLEVFKRTWPYKNPLSDEMAEQVMNVVGHYEEAARWSLMHHERPPALVLDTFKRFNIAHKNNQFITRLQHPESLLWKDNGEILHLLLRMPDWPEGRVFQIVDAQGNVIRDYTFKEQKSIGLRLPMENLQRDGLFITLQQALDETSSAQLGLKPGSAQARANALAAKVAAFAQTQKSSLLSLHYSSSENFPAGPMAVIHSHYKHLPASVAQEVLHHASASEVQALVNTQRVPLRMAEEIRHYTQEKQMARAIEGCYINNNETDLTRRLLSALFDQTPRGQHYLNTSPTSLKRVPGAETGFTPAQKELLVGLVKSDPALREEIVAYARRNPDRARNAIGLQPVKPWFKSPMRLANGRLGYPLSGDVGEGRTGLLLRHIRRIYPTYTHSQSIELIRSLNKRNIWPEGELVRRELELEALKDALSLWVQLPLSASSAAARPDVEPITIKRAVSYNIIRAWRRETKLQDTTVLSPNIDFKTLSYESLPDVRGYLLDLTGFPVDDLPALSGDFSHISVLVMDHMQLSEPPEPFLGCFPHLRWLSMQHNTLVRLPATLKNMKGLQKLNVSNNKIVLMPSDAHALADLTALKELNLSYNPLGHEVEVSNMQNLQHLDMRQTQSEYWPVGVHALNKIGYLDLRDNLIKQIPDAAFSAPQPMNEVTYLDDNPLTPVSEERLNRYAEDTGINMGYISGRGHEYLEDPEDYSWFLSGAEHIAVKRRDIWRALKDEKAARDLRRVFTGLRATPAYANANTRPELIDRVGTVLDALAADTELRQNLIARAGHGSTCGDGMALVFSDLEILTLVAQAKAKVGGSETQELLRLARRLYRLDQVELLARHAIEARRHRIPGGELDELEELDDVAFRLAFRVALAEPLELPAQPQSLAYEYLADLSDQAIEAVHHRVLANERFDTNLLDSICERDFWIEFLKNKFADQFGALYEQYAQRSDVVESESEALTSHDYKTSLDAINADYSVALKELVARLTRQEMDAHPF